MNEDECLAATGRLWLWRRMPVNPLFAVPSCTHGVPLRERVQPPHPFPPSSATHNMTARVRPQAPSPLRHTQDGSALPAGPAPPRFALSDIALSQWQAESRAARPIDQRWGRVRARGAPGLPSRAAVGPGRRERGVGGMARRLRAAMALLLLQALPEGLPAGAEPAQVRGGPLGEVWGRAVPGHCVPGNGGGCECGALRRPLGQGVWQGVYEVTGGRGFWGPA